ncbi:MAG: hypothetical protein P8Y29_02965 [Gemmatimonadota bacterium]
MAGFFSWVVIGLLAGMLAKLIKPGRQRGGCILTTLLGVAGALVAPRVMLRNGASAGLRRLSDPVRPADTVQ